MTFVCSLDHPRRKKPTISSDLIQACPTEQFMPNGCRWCIRSSVKILQIFFLTGCIKQKSRTEMWLKWIPQVALSGKAPFPFLFLPPWVILFQYLGVDADRKQDSHARIYVHKLSFWLLKTVCHHIFTCYWTNCSVCLFSRWGDSWPVRLSACDRPLCQRIQGVSQ